MFCRCVLFYIVVLLNVLNCKKDDKIDLSLTKKEAEFVLDVLSSSIQNGTEEPGQDYKSDDSDESPNSNDMVEGIDALQTSTYTCCINLRCAITTEVNPKKYGQLVLNHFSLRYILCRYNVQCAITHVVRNSAKSFKASGA